MNRVYFFDLLGRGMGCMLLWPLLELLDGPSAVISSGAIFAAAGAIWFTLAGSLRGRVISVTAALTLVAFLTYNRHTISLASTMPRNTRWRMRRSSSGTAFRASPSSTTLETRKGSGRPPIPSASMPTRRPASCQFRFRPFNARAEAAWLAERWACAALRRAPRRQRR